MPSENLKAFQARKHQREEKIVSIVLCVKGICGTVMTKDMSDGGMALNLVTARDLPELQLGGIVSTRLEDAVQTSARVGKVVRITDTELALEYC